MGVERVARHIWTVLCSRAIIDRETNKISLFDAFDEILVEPGEAPPEGEKRIVFRFEGTLASLWMRSVRDVAEVVQIRIRMFSPQNEVIAEHEAELELTSPVLRSVLRLEALPFVGFGEYNFVLETKDREKARYKELARVPYVLRPRPEPIKQVEIKPKRKQTKRAKRS